MDATMDLVSDILTMGVDTTTDLEDGSFVQRHALYYSLYNADGNVVYEGGVHGILDAVLA